MLPTLSGFQIACVIFLATLVPLAQAESAQGSFRMNQTAVSVTSLASPDPAVEGILFSGQATVYSRLAENPESGSSTLVLLIDLSGVVGVGAQSGTRYLLSSQEYLVRPHVANHHIDFYFPMATDQNAPIASVRTGAARFVMNVDPVTGVITSLASSLTPR